VVEDTQVSKAMTLMKKGLSLTKAAMKTSMDPRTLRKYVKLGRLPSQRERRHWRTREDPFDADHLAWAHALWKEEPSLEAKTLFDALCERHPERYTDGQLRTFQRRIERWRATEGPPQEVWFAQEHRPGEAAQTDFTWVTELGVTIAGLPAPSMLCHTVLPFSNVENAMVCHSESMLAIRGGVQRAFFGWGHVPEYLQTDNSTAATHRMGSAGDGERAYNDDYLALLEYLGVKPRRIQVGASEQNGDVESSNGGLKRALRQRLLLRGSADFDTVEAWQAFVDDVIARRNRSRQAKFVAELAHMKPLTVAPAPAWKELDVKVARGGILCLKGNVYSVPTRLIGKRVQVRLYEARVEVWFGGERQFEVGRLIGRGQRAIHYRHIIWSLVKKPAAFARYRYREALFPTETFRAAFDRLEAALRAGTRTDLEYLRILHLAASELETDVEAALKLLMAEGGVPRFEDVRGLVKPTKPPCPKVDIGSPDLGRYDDLLGAA
jgi:hypothetical protein